MGNKIRRVPSDWEHPRDSNDNYQPMYNMTYARGIVEWLTYELRWHLWPPKRLYYIGELVESFPDRNYHRPRFRSSSTHYQIYETVTEGTPTSPVFASLKEMKDWLVKEGFSEHAASMFTETGYAPSMVFTPGRGVSGIGIHSLDHLPAGGRAQST